MKNLTKDAIKKSFIKLLNERPFNKITVKNIVEDCEINRNSFYYHYDDIPALVNEIFLTEYNNLINKYPSFDNLDLFIEDVISKCMNNKKALLHIFNSINRDTYEKYCMKVCEGLVTNYINDVFKDKHIDDTKKKICIDSLKCMFFGFCIDWTNNNLDEKYIKDFHYLCNLLHKIADIIINE